MAKNSGMGKLLDLFNVGEPDDIEDDLFEGDEELDEDEDDAWEDDDDDDDDVPSLSQKFKDTTSKFSNMFSKSFPSRKKIEEEESSSEPERTPVKKAAPSPNSGKILSMRNESNRSYARNSRSLEVYVIRPRDFNEAQSVADYLKDGKAIVINMEGVEISTAQRIIDFIGGACYALDGSLQAISVNIFIAAPSDIDVSGDLREEIMNENTVSPELGRY